MVPTVEVLSDVVKDSPNKIFIGGISKDFSSDTLLDIVRAFGLLRAYRFEFIEELNGPCAFLEYEDHLLTQKACAGLNGMKLGGQVITAVQAFLDSNWGEGDVENLPSYGIPPHAKSLLLDSTRVLQLKNVFNPEDFTLLPESEVEEILEDIKLECARFGTVKSINVVRFKKDTSTGRDTTEGSEEQDAHKGADMPLMMISEANNAGENCKNGDLNTTDLVVGGGEVKDTRDDKEQADSSSGNQLKANESNESGDPDGSQLEDPSDLDDTRIHTAPLETPLDADVTVEKVADSEARLIDDVENSRIVLENRDSKLEEGNVGNEDGSHRDVEGEQFEPGCVLVEFLREEAARNAAHCLHLRYYGDRIVSAGYAAYDHYIAYFRK